MKRIMLIMLLSGIILSLQAQQKAKTMKGEYGISYLIATPKNYSESGKPSPLLLFLHGSGERGDDITKVKKWGPPKILENGGELPFIVVSPQCPAGDNWNVEGLKDLLDELMEAYNVDKSRIYLTGLSMGGFGSFGLAIEYPEIWAAVAPVCGGGDVTKVHKMKNIPTWIFHGKLDEAVPYQRSVDMVEGLKKAGAEPKFTTLDEGGHIEAWVHAYNEAGLWEWFLKHKK